MESERTLPSFMIVGVEKAGTTSLAAWLREHPQVFMATPKELAFFDDQYDLGLDWYAQHFADSRHHRASGEATPNYVYYDTCLDRIARDVPGVSLLVLLRDPADRAYSHYQAYRARGIEELSFEEAIIEEQMHPRLSATLSDRRELREYVDRGRYVRQLHAVFERFPRESVHVMLFEHLRDDPVAAFRQVATFLSVDPAIVPSLVGSVKNRHRGSRYRRIDRYRKRLPPRVGRLFVPLVNSLGDRAYEPMPERARASLREIFLPERAELAALTGLDLGRWTD